MSTSNPLLTRNDVSSAAPSRLTIGPEPAPVGQELPLVSVVVPMFNAKHTVCESLVSILATEWPRLEVIVVDDASGDDSAAVVARYVDARPDANVRLLRHPDAGNHGAAASRNLGAAQAGGDYLCFLDADDCYLPSRIHEAVTVLQSDQTLDAVYGLFEYELPTGATECRDVTEAHVGFDARGVADAMDDPFLSQLRGRSGGHVSTVTLRRQCFADLGGFPPHLQYGEDQAFWLRLTGLKRVRRIGARPVSRYRIHPDSLCSRGQRSAEFLFGPVKARLDALSWLQRHGGSRQYRDALARDLFGRIVGKYHEAHAAGRDCEQQLLRLLLRAAWLHPAGVFRGRVLNVLFRLATGIAPRGLPSPRTGEVEP